MTRNEQKEKRRLDILHKGLELFVEKGYKATKITDIAYALDIRPIMVGHALIDVFTVVWILITSISPDFYQKLLSMQFISV